jgi:hypothetical protein
MNTDGNFFLSWIIYLFSDSVYLTWILRNFFGPHVLHTDPCIIHSYFIANSYLRMCTANIAYYVTK